MMNMSELNNHVDETYCADTNALLTDEALLEQYKNQKSVKNIIDVFRREINREIDDERKVQRVLNRILLHIIPAGTKGVVRGLEFNRIIKKLLVGAFDRVSTLWIAFETHAQSTDTDECPDFVITDRRTNKTIIGFNQVDFTRGGAQLNRGFKYVMANKSSKDVLFLSVICNKVRITKPGTKKFRLYQTGFANKTLCYPKELTSIVASFLQLHSVLSKTK